MGRLQVTRPILFIVLPKKPAPAPCPGRHAGRNVSRSRGVRDRENRYKRNGLSVSDVQSSYWVLCAQSLVRGANSFLKEMRQGKMERVEGLIRSGLISCDPTAPPLHLRAPQPMGAWHCAGK